MLDLRTFATPTLLCLFASGALQAQQQHDTPLEADEWQPWTLQNALVGDSTWLNVRGETRVRWEGISGQFRSASRLDDNDNAGFQRTSLRADATFEPASFTLELLDSRHYGGSRGSSLNTSSVNTIDFLQAHSTLHFGQLGSGEHDMRVGRYTIDIGSRRLISRNGFRNTINSYTGADWKWRGDTATATAFWSLPVRRKPSALSRVVDNEPVLDTQDLDLQYFGAHFEQRFDERDAMEIYTLVLLEDDVGTRERELYTPGVRLRRKPARGEIDYELESMYQFGESRLSSSGTSDLDHNAWFQHASIGYMFDTDKKTRVRAAIDYASGDNDGSDGQNNRFDTLFGSRGFDYGGPTGLWGAIARSNILSPEVRVTWEPRPDMHLWFAWRGVWLASDVDAWTTARVQDSTGASGRHVGQQLTGRWRWYFYERKVLFDMGAAYLFDGRYQRSVTGGHGSDSTYAYAAFTWKF